MSSSGVIPVVEIVRRMLLKRAVRVQRSSGFVLAAMAFVCVVAMMFCVTGVPPGSGVRMGIDRDLDGILDGD